MEALTQLQDAVVTAADTTGPSVVAVGRGAGMVVAQDRILTNAHNLTGPRVSVRFGDGRAVDAEVIASDLDGDLAVVTADTGGAPAVTWADAAPGLGAAVFAFGAPHRGPARITVGFVSATDRRFRGPRGRRLLGVEHTAPVGRGSSGAPLTDTEGRVVGIDTHRRGDGFYLALPVDETLRARVEALSRGESPTRRRIGIAIAPPEVARRLRAAVGLDDRDGVLVREVEDHGPGDVAGLRAGDLIVAADGVVISRPDDLLDAVERAGSTLTLQVVRGESERELTLDLDAEHDGAQIGEEEPPANPDAPDA